MSETGIPIPSCPQSYKIQRERHMFLTFVEIEGLRVFGGIFIRVVKGKKNIYSCGKVFGPSCPQSYKVQQKPHMFLTFVETEGLMCLDVEGKKLFICVFGPSGPQSYKVQREPHMFLTFVETEGLRVFGRRGKEKYLGLVH